MDFNAVFKFSAKILNYIVFVTDLNKKSSSITKSFFDAKIRF